MTNKKVDEKVEDLEVEQEVSENIQDETDSEDSTENTGQEEALEETSEEVISEDPEVELQKKIDDLQSRLDTEEEKNLKQLAEFENFKRRNKQEIDLNNKYRDQKFAENLLPVVDNLERALSIEGDSESFISIKKGVEMVHKDLLNTFGKHDITVIESVGAEFDPNLHQAVMTEASDADSGIVIEEFQKGYKLKDRVLRPSMVKVSE